jgi:hypothetical protein
MSEDIRDLSIDEGRCTDDLSGDQVPDEKRGGKTAMLGPARSIFGRDLYHHTGAGYKQAAKKEGSSEVSSEAAEKKPSESSKPAKLRK